MNESFTNLFSVSLLEVFVLSSWGLSELAVIFFAAIIFAAEFTRSGAYVGVVLVACVFWYVVVSISIGGLGGVLSVVPDVAVLMSSCLTDFARLILSFFRLFLTVDVAWEGVFRDFGEVEPGALRGDSRGRRRGEADFERRRRGDVFSSSGDFSPDNFRGGIAVRRCCTSLA